MREIISLGQVNKQTENLGQSYKKLIDACDNKDREILRLNRELQSYRNSPANLSIVNEADDTQNISQELFRLIITNQ